MSEKAPPFLAKIPMDVPSNARVTLLGSAFKASKRPASPNNLPLVQNHDQIGSFSCPDEVAGVYAPLLRMRKRRCLPALPIVPLPPHVIGGLRDQIEKVKQCNCKRSNCLKLYCDCFQNGLHCNAFCNCLSCMNLPGTAFSAQRTKAILVTLDRNQHAFRPRLFSLGDDQHKVRGSTGCHCKKSFCLKKYCECYHAIVFCSDNCNCEKCKNVPGNRERELLMKKRRSKDESVAAAAAAHQQHTRMSGRMAMDRIIEGRDDVLGDMSLTSGIDPFIPASAHSLPVRVVVHNLTYGALAFGSLDNKNYTKEPVKIHGARPQAKQSKKPAIGRFTEVQEAWNKQANRTFAVFGVVKKEIKRRQGLAVVDVPLDDGVRKQAVAILDRVTKDMHLVQTAVDQAKRRALQDFAEQEKIPEPKEANVEYQSLDNGDKNSLAVPRTERMRAELLCNEELCEVERVNLSSEGKRQLAILAALDAAMLSQLAKIIRAKAVKMAEERLKSVGVVNT